MDPRLKMDWYKAIEWEEAWQEQAKQDLLNFWELHYKNRVDVNDDRNFSDPEKRADEDTEERDLFEKMLEEKMKNFQTPEDELKQYLSEPVVAAKSVSVGGVLLWWKVIVIFLYNLKFYKVSILKL